MNTCIRDKLYDDVLINERGKKQRGWGQGIYLDISSLELAHTSSGINVSGYMLLILGNIEPKVTCGTPRRRKSMFHHA